MRYMCTFVFNNSLFYYSPTRGIYKKKYTCRHALVTLSRLKHNEFRVYIVMLNLMMVYMVVARFDVLRRGNTVKCVQAFLTPRTHDGRQRDTTTTVA